MHRRIFILSDLEGSSCCPDYPATTFMGPFILPGPYRTAVSMRDGATPAKQIAKRWGLERKQNTLYFRAENIQDLYLTLIRIAYLTPFLERTLPLGLMLYHLMGWLGRARALRTSPSSRS